MTRKRKAEPGEHHAALDQITRRGLSKHQAFNSFLTDLANSNSAEANRLSEKVQSHVEKSQDHLMNYARLRVRSGSGQAQAATVPKAEAAPAKPGADDMALANGASILSLVGKGTAISAGMVALAKLGGGKFGAAAKLGALAFGSNALADHVSAEGDKHRAAAKAAGWTPSSAAGPGNAHLNSAAAAKAAAADKAAAQPPPSAPATGARPAAQPQGPAGRSSYTTKDGRTVEATEGQSKAWQARRTTGQ
jgi:hypothetical protein